MVVLCSSETSYSSSLSMGILQIAMLLTHHLLYLIVFVLEELKWKWLFLHFSIFLHKFCIFHIFVTCKGLPYRYVPALLPSPSIHSLRKYIVNKAKCKMECPQEKVTRLFHEKRWVFFFYPRYNMYIFSASWYSLAWWVTHTVCFWGCFIYFASFGKFCGT